MEEQSLIKAANVAREHAYAPYSGFRVGAALLTSLGDIFVGCNVENLSLGLTICAERAAVATAVATGARDFTTIVIVTDFPHPVFPCGACRQVLAEFNPAIDVVSVTIEGQRKSLSLADLLPYAGQKILSGTNVQATR